MKQQILSPFVRSTENPLIAPRENVWWESWQTFNPGAILLDNKIHIIYRAMGDDGISRLGYANSKEGFKIDERLDYPVYQVQGNSPVFSWFSYASGGGWGGVEDPRVVRVDGEDLIYMTYTAFDSGLSVGLTSIQTDDFLNKRWNWAEPQIISPPNEYHKNWVLFPEKIKGKYAIMHSLTPRIAIAYLDSLNFLPGYYVPSYYNGGNGYGREKFWDSVIRGIGPPPVRTDKGWLLFYHAIDRNEPYKYKVGAVLTDIDDPTRVIRCASSPVMQPETVYENQGFKPGVIYLTSAIVKDDKLLLYYGASDNYVCVAGCVLNDFLDALMDGGRHVFNEVQLTPTPPQESTKPLRRTPRTSSGRKPGMRKGRLKKNSDNSTL